jgi:hypothetical protein
MLVLKKKNYCFGCGKQISMQKAFCNNSCKDRHFDLMKIQIPQLFIKRLSQHFKTDNDKKAEIVRFSERHNLNEILTIEKVNKLLKEYESNN